MKFSHPLLLFILLVLTSFSSCSPNQRAQKWVRKTEYGWNKWEKSQPQWLEMLDSTALQEQLLFLNHARKMAQKWLHTPIDAAIKVNVKKMDSLLTKAKSRLERQQADPSVYNLGLRLQNLYPAKAKMEASDLDKLTMHLDQAALYYNQARQKLKRPLAVKCDSAVHQHIKSITFLLEDLSAQIDLLNLSTPRSKAMHAKVEQAVLYMKDHLAWCRSMAFELRNATLDQ